MNLLQALTLAFSFSIAAVPASTSGAAPVLAAPLVLQRYSDALERISLPRAVVFVYNVEQVGMHDIEQVHRIYRSDVGERDETIAVDGRRLPVPSVRIFKGRADHYDIALLAPHPELYTFTFVKAQRSAGRVQYIFHTMRSPEQAAFVVTDIAIDGQSFLPSVMNFRMESTSIPATGQLVYSQVNKFWLIREASVSALVNSKSVRERFLWTAYQFPPALPAATFSRRATVKLPL